MYCMGPREIGAIPTSPSLSAVNMQVLLVGYLIIVTVIMIIIVIFSKHVTLMLIRTVLI